MWNKHADEEPDHKKVFVEILCPEEVKMSQLGKEDGFRIFSHALKLHAQSLPENQRRNISN